MTKEKNKTWGNLKECLERIFILVSMQLKNIGKNRVQNKGRKALSFVMVFVKVLIITIVLYLMLKYIGALLSLGFIVSYEFLSLYIGILQGIAIVSCTLGMMQSLFLDRDNVLLLAFPCRHTEVFVSKLIVYYFCELRRSIFGILPLLITIGVLTKESVFSTYAFTNVNYFSWIPYVVIILPMVPVIIGSLLSLPASIVKRLIESDPIIELFSIIGLSLAAFFASIALTNKLPNNIPIITEYIVLIEKTKTFVNNFSNYTLYSRFFTNILYNNKVFINFVYISLIVVFGLLLVTLIIMPFYFIIASQSMEVAREKKHKVKDYSSKNIFISFIKKEYLVKYRDIGNAVSSYLLILFMPSILIFILGIYTRLMLNTSGGPLYVSFFTVFFVFIMLLTSNTDIATSITREGSEFVLLKTAPTDASKTTWAKLFVEISILTLIMLISYILLKTGLKITDSKYFTSDVFILFFIAYLTNVGMAFKGMSLDIMNPSLIEYSSTKSIKENSNIEKMIEEGVVITIIYTIFYIVFKLIGLSKIAILLLLLISIVYLVFRIFNFKNKLFAFFDDIEV